MRGFSKLTSYSSSKQTTRFAKYFLNNQQNGKFPEFGLGNGTSEVSQRSTLRPLLFLLPNTSE